MKDGIAQVVGKQIAAVVIAENKRDPKRQVFLVFSDGTSFELYGSSFNGCGGLDNATGVMRYIASSGAEVVQVFGKAGVPKALTTGPSSARYDVRPDDSSLEELLTRDLDALREAKAAIRKAKDA